MNDLLDLLHTKATELPAVKPPKLKRPAEPPVEPALIDPDTVNPAKLHKVGRCCRCQQVQWSFEDITCNLCCECAALEVIRDPRKSYPPEVWTAAKNMARHSNAQQIVWRLGIELETAIKFRWRMLRYDPADDSRRSTELAWAEMRKNIEAGK
jgi:hypothetical protein